MLAVGQIVISLFAALNLPSNFSPAYLSFGSVFFGTLVLAYSLLLGMSDFSSRAVKLHACGLELGRLARQLYELVEKNAVDEPLYKEISTEYYNILDKYENHTRADGLVARYEYYRPKMVGIDLFSRAWIGKSWDLATKLVEFALLHLLQFSHYVISVALISFWIFSAISVGKS
jgi:hypothetical protein